MSVNPEIQGKTYPSTPPYAVGREKIREFARAVLAVAAVHYDEEQANEAGFSDLVAPPTFPVVIQEQTLAQLLEDSEAGVDFSRVVHGDQRFTYSRPVIAGDVLTAQLTVAAVKQLGGHSMVTARTEMTDAEGAHVVTAISTLVVRGEEAA